MAMGMGMLMRMKVERERGTTAYYTTQYIYNIYIAISSNPRVLSSPIFLLFFSSLFV